MINYLKNNWKSLLLNTAIAFALITYINAQQVKYYSRGLDDGIKASFDTINKVLIRAKFSRVPVGLSFDGADVYILNRSDLLKTLRDGK